MRNNMDIFSISITITIIIFATIFVYIQMKMNRFIKKLKNEPKEIQNKD